MNFAELNDLLIEAHAGTRAAECHGFLSGYLCVVDSVSSEIYKQFLLANMDKQFSERCEHKISELADEISSGITSSDFSFELLLPGDETGLSERSEALVQWCEGFLSGLGTAGITDPDILSAECRELIQDLYQICRLDLDEINNNGSDEESAFTELSEYVRIGAITLYEEFRQKRLESGQVTIH